ncbi:MAG: hypothetical protein C4523_13310 [Myxococcales bacterium]|nr:MAG: hypothetical protein C4523_13310 [Myxococcales bacterium]
MKKRYVLFALVVAATAWPVTAAFSAPPSVCEGLDAEKQGLFARLLDTLHPYDCCDETISVCLTKQPVCPLAERLGKDVCRLVKLGKNQAEIEHAMLKRAQSMTPLGKPASFALDETMLAGDPAAPVTVVVYACTRCPFCKVAVPALYRLVAEGALKGKAKLYFRPFPLKDHVGSLEGGLAVEAAARMGKFWPYLLRVYERYDAFKPDLLAAWAAELGLDRSKFERLLAEPATKESLGLSKQEGVRNKVTATPTLFINGRKYVYEMATDVLKDVLDEEHGKLTNPR